MLACDTFKWRLHAHVVMRNHFHLALETPDGNLVTGMHWLQSTYATRFNRFRSERGHLFQGRYQTLLIEDAAVLGRVADHILLNPVRGGIVPPEHLAGFRWSSLRWFLKAPRPGCLHGNDVIGQHGLDDSPEGWKSYVALLARDENFVFAAVQKVYTQIPGEPRDSRAPSAKFVFALPASSELMRCREAERVRRG